MFIGLIVLLSLGWMPVQAQDGYLPPDANCVDHRRGAVSLGESVRPLGLASEACFDFGDGKGHVPAHRHGNGGGWVAETAHVVPDAYVGAQSLVYGNAEVYKGVIIADGRVSGGVLRGSVIVTGGGHVAGGILEAMAYDSDKLLIDGSWVTGGRLMGSVQLKGEDVWVSGGMIFGLPGREVLISDNVHISDGRISGKVYIKENAWILGGEIVGTDTHNIQIGGEAVIYGGAITGNTIVSDRAKIYGGHIEGTAFVDPLAVAGDSYVSNGARLTGSGILRCGSFDKPAHFGGIRPHRKLVDQGCYQKEFRF